MSGTVQGGARARDTNKALHGEDFYHRLGKLGGRAGTGHKFAHGKVDPAQAGIMGGKISRRGAWTDAERAARSLKVKAGLREIEESRKSKN